MPWSAEQKRAARAAKKRKSQQQQQEQSKKLMAVAPPTSALKTPYKPEQLGQKIDYGGHHLALNFPTDKTEIQLSLSGKATSMCGKQCNSNAITKIGDLSIGLAFDGDWKAKSRMAGNGERRLCKRSQEFIQFLFVVRSMLTPMVKPCLAKLMDDCLRVNILCGARTKAHTDSYRGNTPNFLYIVEDKKRDPGWLVYDTFPSFKSSVVTIDGKYYIPHSYSEASNECRCIGENPNKKGFPVYYIFQADVIDKMQPYGLLPWGVVGWKKNGKVQVIPEEEESRLYTSPLVFFEATWDYVLQVAGHSQNRQLKKPHPRLKKLDKVDCWQKFWAYKYRHWWNGNHMVLRHHAFFRTMRHSPTSSNVVRKGIRTNYIDAKGPTWKQFTKDMEWEDLDDFEQELHWGKLSC